MEASRWLRLTRAGPAADEVWVAPKIVLYMVREAGSGFTALYCQTPEGMQVLEVLETPAEIAAQLAP